MLDKQDLFAIGEVVTGIVQKEIAMSEEWMMVRMDARIDGLDAQIQGLKTEIIVLLDEYVFPQIAELQEDMAKVKHRLRLA